MAITVTTSGIEKRKTSMIGAGKKSVQMHFTTDAATGSIDTGLKNVIWVTMAGEGHADNQVSCARNSQTNVSDNPTPRTPGWVRVTGMASDSYRLYAEGY